MCVGQSRPRQGSFRSCLRFPWVPDCPSIETAPAPRPALAVSRPKKIVGLFVGLREHPEFPPAVSKSYAQIGFRSPESLVGVLRLLQQPVVGYIRRYRANSPGQHFRLRSMLRQAWITLKNQPYDFLVQSPTRTILTAIRGQRYLMVLMLVSAIQLSVTSVKTAGYDRNGFRSPESSTTKRPPDLASKMALRRTRNPCGTGLSRFFDFRTFSQSAVTSRTTLLVFCWSDRRGDSECSQTPRYARSSRDRRRSRSATAVVCMSW